MSILRRPPGKSLSTRLLFAAAASFSAFTVRGQADDLHPLRNVGATIEVLFAIDPVAPKTNDPFYVSFFSTELTESTNALEGTGSGLRKSELLFKLQGVQLRNLAAEPSFKSRLRSD